MLGIICSIIEGVCNAAFGEHESHEYKEDEDGHGQYRVDGAGNRCYDNPTFDSDDYLHPGH